MFENLSYVLCQVPQNNDYSEMPVAVVGGSTPYTNLRKTFMKNIREEVSQFKHFTDMNIVEYCMLLKDPKIQKPMAMYVKDILQ